MFELCSKQVPFEFIKTKGVFAKKKVHQQLELYNCDVFFHNPSAKSVPSAVSDFAFSHGDGKEQYMRP